MNRIFFSLTLVSQSLFAYTNALDQKKDMDCVEDAHSAIIRLFYERLQAVIDNLSKN
ncbi:hypothetical protein [Moraxella bovis]|uniref:hypothetical protein n=1 Tax=Moraxella bovis TaxID=476 RepID=UPI0015F17A21|nr:hypothetical protein [Moraxella bovis]